MEDIITNLTVQAQKIECTTVHQRYASGLYFSASMEVVMENCNLTTPNSQRLLLP